tara:strand:- start:652 stop:3483 length:2832 start_codon:yes stop_codon:yes gene_type:complete
MQRDILNEVVISGLIKEQNENNESFMKKVLVDLGVVIDGTFTFGTGITAFLPTVRELLKGGSPNITEQDIILIYITAMWILLSRNKDKIEKSLVIIREKGLTSLLSKVFDFLKSTEDIVLKMSNEVGYTANSLVDVTAFTFMTFPLLDILVGLINDGTINVSDPAGYLKSVLISVGLLSVKNGFNTIIKNIKRKYGKLDERINRPSRLLVESVEDRYYDQLTTQIVKDIMFSIKKTILKEDSTLMYLPEDITGEITYNDTTINLELTISRNEEIEEDFLIEAYYSPGDDTIELGLEINPLNEPGSYQKIYAFLIEYVRHELVHHEQNEMGELPTDEEEKEMSNLDYYLQSHEVPAQIKGLDLRARKTKEDYKDVVRKSIEFSKQRYGLTDDDSKTLYTKLIDGIENQLVQTNLNEQTESKTGIKQRVVLDTDEYKIIVPLTWDSLCYYANDTSWCRDDSGVSPTTNVAIKSIKKRFNENMGSVYVVIFKNSTYAENWVINKYIVDVFSKIPLMIHSGDRKQLWDRKSQYNQNLKKVFSQHPELQKFFKLEYTLRDRIRYDVSFNDDELSEMAKENNFTKILYKLWLDTYDEEVVEEDLEDFTGADMRFAFSSTDQPNSEDRHTTIHASSTGLEFNVPHDMFVYDYLKAEDDSWMIDNIFNDSGYNYEELESEEMNYIQCYYSDSSWSNLIAFMKDIDLLEPGSPENCGHQDFEDGRLMDILEENFPSEYVDFEKNVLSSLGYSLYRERVKNLRETWESETLIEVENYYMRYFSFELSWSQLLVIASRNNITSLSDLAETDEFELDYSLSDSWYDAYGFDDEGAEEASNDLDVFVKEIKTASEDSESLTNTVNFKKIAAELGFKWEGRANRGWNNNIGFKPLKIPELNKEVILWSWEPSKNELSIKIKENGEFNASHVINPQELSNYVVSNEIPYPTDAAGNLA